MTGLAVDAPAGSLEPGPLALDEQSVFATFGELFPLEGASVLELGGSLDPALVRRAGITSWVAVDPRNVDAGGDGYRSVAASAARLPLSDRSVDLVFSSNALQHIRPLAETFAEVGRVLRPGGFAYFGFGPVWSAPDGSHVENLRVGGRRYDFWSVTLVPPWAHLVLGEGELGELLASLFGEEVGRAAARWIFHTSWLNRVPLHRLLELVAASPLRVASVRGCTEFGYDFDPPPVPDRFRARLELESVRRRARELHGIPAGHLPVRDVELILESRS